MKAIQVRYHGPTDSRGSRLTATAEGGPKPHRVTVGYNYALSGDPLYRTAAVALCEKMGWPVASLSHDSGQLPDGDYVFVFSC